MRNTPPSMKHPYPNPTPVFLEEQFGMEALPYLAIQKPNSDECCWDFFIRLADGNFVGYSINTPTEKQTKAIFERIVELFAADP